MQRSARPRWTRSFHTATLHKPHVATHSWQDFIDINITGTRTLLEAANAAGHSRFIFTSTTSAFGDALRPAPGEPAAWISEDVTGRSKNIYGATKNAAEDLVQLAARETGLATVILRTSRFFAEEDDDPQTRAAYCGENARANEFLFRRVDLEDAATAHICALERAPEASGQRFIVSATTPFQREDAARLPTAPMEAVAQYFPDAGRIYHTANFQMFPSITRVYDNAAARNILGWKPKHDFQSILAQIDERVPIGSALARKIGAKGYHKETFTEGPYPVTLAPKA